METQKQMPPPPLLRLPDELLVQVLDSVTSRCHPSSPPSPSPSPCPQTVSHISAASRVCRRLHLIASPLVYHYAVLSDLATTLIPRGLDSSALDSPQSLLATLNSIQRQRQQKEETIPVNNFLLAACASGNDRVVEKLCQAAERLPYYRRSPYKKPRELIGCAQTYLAARFLTISDCPVRHWPLLFPHEYHNGGDDSDPALSDSSSSYCSPPQVSLSTYSTALHVASQHGHRSTVQLLVSILKGDGGYQEEEEQLGGHYYHDSSKPLEELLAITTADPASAAGQLFTGAVMANAVSPLAAALDAPVPLACLCPSRHLPALISSEAGLGRSPGIISGPEPSDWPFSTPLMLSLAHGHGTVAKLLISYGANWAMPALPSASVVGHATPLHIMAANCMDDLVEWLSLRRPSPIGGCVDWPDQEGRSVFHYAALSCRPHPVAPSLPHNAASDVCDGHDLSRPARANVYRLVHALRSLGLVPSATNQAAISAAETSLVLVRTCRRRVQYLLQTWAKTVAPADNDDDNSVKLNGKGRRSCTASPQLSPSPFSGQISSAIPLPSGLVPLPFSRDILQPTFPSPWWSIDKAVCRRFQIRHREALDIFSSHLFAGGADVEGNSGEGGVAMNAVVGTGEVVDTEAAFCLRHLDLLERDMLGVLEWMREVDDDDATYGRWPGDLCPISLAQRHGFAELIDALSHLEIK